MLDEWTKELTPSMIPDGICRTIAEEIGTDNLLKLCVLIGGSTFYFPFKDNILLQLRNHKIIEEFNGYNTAKLARKYNVGVRSIQRVIKRAAGKSAITSKSEEDN